jgi:hypothetical protein
MIYLYFNCTEIVPLLGTCQRRLEHHLRQETPTLLLLIQIQKQESQVSWFMGACVALVLVIFGYLIVVRD